MKYKHCLGLLLGLLIAFLVAPAAKAQVKSPKMDDCHSYVVMDAGSGNVLLEQDGSKKIYPASTTKVMTAIVCTEKSSMDVKIKTKHEVVHGTEPGLYNVGIGSGVTYTARDLLNISLVASSADATDSLAVGVFGNKPACVDAMNAKVKELGLVNTHFDNPVGADLGSGYDNNYSTAREMARIIRYAMTIPEIRKAVRKKEFTSSNGHVTVSTTNRFLRGSIPYRRSRYQIIGTKSGTTNAGGHVFIATAKDDQGHEVICAYFGTLSVENTFYGMEKLFNYTFDHYDKGKLTLSPSGYDIRSKGEIGAAFTKYADTNSLPTEADGTFKANQIITRGQLAKMLSGVLDLPDNGDLERFSLANSTADPTVLNVADLIQELYPSHLSDREIKDALKKCKDTSDLSDTQKEAYAILVKNKLVSENIIKNPRQVLTRGEALLLADRLTDYQMFYLSKHGNFTSLSDFAGTVAARAEQSGSEVDSATTEAPDVTVVIDKDGWRNVVDADSQEAKAYEKKQLKKKKKEYEKEAWATATQSQAGETTAATEASTQSQAATTVAPADASTTAPQTDSSQASTAQSAVGVTAETNQTGAAEPAAQAAAETATQAPTAAETTTAAAEPATQAPMAAETTAAAAETATQVPTAAETTTAPPAEATTQVQQIVLPQIPYMGITALNQQWMDRLLSQYYKKTADAQKKAEAEEQAAEDAALKKKVEDKVKQQIAAQEAATATTAPAQ